MVAIISLQFELVAACLTLSYICRLYVNANRSRNLLLTDHPRLHYVEFVAFDTAD